MSREPEYFYWPKDRGAPDYYQGGIVSINDCLHVGNQSDNGPFNSFYRGMEYNYPATVGNTGSEYVIAFWPGTFYNGVDDVKPDLSQLLLKYKGQGTLQIDFGTDVGSTWSWWDDPTLIAWSSGLTLELNSSDWATHVFETPDFALDLATTAPWEDFPLFKFKVVSGTIEFDTLKEHSYGPNGREYRSGNGRLTDFIVPPRTVMVSAASNGLRSSPGDNYQYNGSISKPAGSGTAAPDAAFMQSAVETVLAQGDAADYNTLAYNDDAGLRNSDYWMDINDDQGSSNQEAQLIFQPMTGSSFGVGSARVFHNSRLEGRHVPNALDYLDSLRFYGFRLDDAVLTAQGLVRNIHFNKIPGTAQGYTTYAETNTFVPAKQYVINKKRLQVASNILYSGGRRGATGEVRVKLWGRTVTSLGLRKKPLLTDPGVVLVAEAILPPEPTGASQTAKSELITWSPVLQPDEIGVELWYTWEIDSYENSTGVVVSLVSDAADGPPLDILQYAVRTDKTSYNYKSIRTDGFTYDLPAAQYYEIEWVREFPLDFTAEGPTGPEPYAISWNNHGTAKFEAGVDRGVLYVGDNAGVPWNGLIRVTETPIGGEARPFYIDGIMYTIESYQEQFSATIEAYSYPKEFGPCEGAPLTEHGFVLYQQEKSEFGLTYRTLIGSDTNELGKDYKLHLVYNALAEPTDAGYYTIGKTAEPATFMWTIYTTPQTLNSNFKPMSHVTIDSTEIDPDILVSIENFLYGTADREPRLPTIAELMGLFNPEIEVIDNGDGTWEVTGSDLIVSNVPPDKFEITAGTAVWVSDTEFEISGTND